jgi:urea transport system permease protein
MPALLRSVDSSRVRWSLIAVCVAAALGSRIVRADASLSAVAGQLGSGDLKTTQGAIAALGQSDDPKALAILRAMEDGRLRVSSTTLQVLIQDADKKLIDPFTNKAVASQPDLKEPLVTNMIRRGLQAAIAQLELHAKDAETRLHAAQVVSESPSAEMAPLLRKAIAVESDAQVKKKLSLALAQIDLESEDAKLRLAAVETIGDLGETSLKPNLEKLLEKRSDGTPAEPDAAVRKAASSALGSLQTKELMVRVARDLLYGLSLGSVLLLAALGLAITFGLMGVINMAHGEMLMLGAYATYVVQKLFESHLPGALDYYLIAALPVAFGVCMLVGMLLEHSVIRFLYGRPLETLLATWGISLGLIQTVRLIFGAQNVTVANPTWLSGGWELMTGIVVPYARLATIVFVGVVVAFVWYLLNRTTLGLQVCAITQNRRMARCVGIRTARVDTLTFGLGSAVAGLGGVALSQLGNVGPELGQGYIVDSFMVVVVGGVGNLFGTLYAALGLGAVNKLLEPVSGAVLGKIFVLGFIILFIQRRPQGLFALKGRAAES